MKPAPLLLASVLMTLAPTADGLSLEEADKAINLFRSVNPKTFLPPAEYDFLYPGILVSTHVATSAELREICRIQHERLMACSQRMGNTGCLIVYGPLQFMLDQGYTFDMVKRHEMAHCNGWPKDHPGIRSETKDKRS